jgi:metal-sulfur cluster biosynthetic enzyme
MSAKEGDALRDATLSHLAGFIDPEAGADVMRPRLIAELTVNEGCTVRYTFRPSSPLCRQAVVLALSFRKAVLEVEGVTDQEIEVVGYVRATELNALLEDL